MFPHRFLSFLAVAPLFLGAVHAAPPPGIRGEYTAVINGDNFDTSGKFRMVLTGMGRGSVSVKVGDEPPCVVGVWPGGNDGGLIGHLPAAMLVDLKLIQLPDGSFQVEGTVDDTDEGETFQIVATQATTSSGPAAGAHTFILGKSTGTADAGSGYAHVARNGHATGVVVVGDHKAVSFGGRLTPDKKLPLAVRFGKTESSLTGDLTFGDTSTTGTASLHDDDGSTPVYSARANYHPRLVAILPSAKAAAAGPRTQLQAQMSGGLAGGTMIQLPNGRFVSVSLNGQAGSLRFVRATGMVVGKCVTGALCGVVLQDANVVAGYCDGDVEFKIGNLPDSAYESGAPSP